MKRPDLLEIIPYAVQKGLRVAMTPSGTPLMTCHAVTQLKEAGLSRLAVSLQHAADALGIKLVNPADIYDVPADIFAPCALGAVVNDQTLARMKFKIIAGAANNQLAENRHGLELHERNILYAPDYVINAGGMINVFVELEGYDRERALRMSRGIFYNLRKVFQIARREGIPTNEAADHLVEERIAMMRHLKGMYTGPHTNRYRWESH